MENLYYIMVLGFAAFVYATFPAERYLKWVERTFGKWLNS